MTRRLAAGEEQGKGQIQVNTCFVAEGASYDGRLRVLLESRSARASHCRAASRVGRLACAAEYVAQRSGEQLGLGDGWKMSANWVLGPVGECVVALCQLLRWLGERTRSPPKMLTAVGTGDGSSAGRAASGLCR